MFKSFLIICMVSSPALSFSIGDRESLCRSKYIVDEISSTCGGGEWSCCDGLCIYEQSVCDGMIHCPDGSDEDEEFCNTLNQSEPIEKNCILPNYPADGTYTMEGNTAASPGEVYDRVFLNITCNPGFSLNGIRSFAYCVKGIGWLDPMPECIAQPCLLPEQKGVEYQCLHPIDGETGCDHRIPSGTSVQPICRPDFTFPDDLPYMTCNEGAWNYIPLCLPKRKPSRTINGSSQMSVRAGDHNVRINTRRGRVEITLKLNIFSTFNLNNTGNVINIDTGNTTVKATDHNSDLDESLWRVGDGDRR